MKNIKKLSLVGILALSLGTAAFARLGDGTGPDGTGSIENCRYNSTLASGQANQNNGQAIPNKGWRMHKDRDHHKQGRGQGMVGKNIMDPEMEKTMIQIDEKRLAIRKELVKDSPDWAAIEKTEVEIATERAKYRTKMLKDRYEEMKKLKAAIDQKEKDATTQSVQNS